MSLALRGLAILGLRLRMRYTRFKGRFVLHCHMLTHEDKGMMELVEV